VKSYGDFSTLGGYLQYLRKEAVLTQSAVVKELSPGDVKAGVKVLSKIENGIQRPSLEEVKKIAVVTGVSASVAQKAYDHFKGGKLVHDKRIDNDIDLRPLLGDLGKSSQPITGLILLEAVEHFVAIKKISS
jgi:transcriptional regulator with XRE-family HTH domain